MTIEEIQKSTEFQVFDRKSARIDAKALAITIIAFANADGGQIALGVEDDGSLTGVDGKTDHVNELLRASFDYCVPSIATSTEYLEVTDVELPCINFLWESEYDYSKQDTLSYLKPSRQLFESMGMMYSDTDGELLDADGNLLCFDACANHNCHEYLLVRKDAFVRYLQSNHKKIVWALIGEKNLMGSMIPHGEWLDISGTYCLDSDNEVKGSMATYLEGKPLNRWAME